MWKRYKKMLFLKWRRFKKPLLQSAKKLSLQIKITGSFTIVLFITLFILVSILTFRIDGQLRSVLLDYGKDLHRDACHATCYGLLFENTYFVLPFLNGIVQDPKILAIELYNLEGKLFIQKTTLDSLASMDSTAEIFQTAEEIILEEVHENWVEIIGPSFYYQPDVDKEHIGYIRILLDKSTLYEFRKNLILTSTFISLIAFLFGAVIAYYLGRRIILPLREMTDKMKLISTGEGDLTQHLSVSSEDEIGVMADSFNEFLKKLNRLIIEIIKTSKEIGKQTVESAILVSEITKRASSQAHFVNATSSSVKQLSNTANSIADDSRMVLRIANASHSSAIAGVESVAQSRQKMQEIQEKNKKATQEILRLGKKSREIQRIMHIIHGISVQSKMIAFNAAIEASISGSIGKRFGVVATQIRELANSVFDSTEEIKRIVQEVQQAVQELLNEFKNEQESIQEGAQTIESAMAVLNHIAEESDRTVIMMRQISRSTKQHTNASGQVVFSLQEILDEANQFRISSGDIQERIEKINSFSQTLLQEIGRFKVN